MVTSYPVPVMNKYHLQWEEVRNEWHRSAPVSDGGNRVTKTCNKVRWDKRNILWIFNMEWWGLLSIYWVQQGMVGTIWVSVECNKEWWGLTECLWSATRSGGDLLSIYWVQQGVVGTYRVTMECIKEWWGLTECLWSATRSGGDIMVTMESKKEWRGVTEWLCSATWSGDLPSDYGVRHGVVGIKRLRVTEWL